MTASPGPPDGTGGDPRSDATALRAAFLRLQPYAPAVDQTAGPSGADRPAEHEIPAAPPPPIASSTPTPGARRSWRRHLRRGAPRATPAGPGIHQFVPTLLAGDAVGRHTQRLRDTIAARGIPSRIYVQGTEPATASETEVFSSYPSVSEPGDVLVYQFATASDLAPWLVTRAETLVVNYHNVTPARLFAPWDPHVAEIQRRAAGELGLMASRTALAIADSSFNVADLAAAGYATTAVVPPIAAIDLRAGADGAPAATGAASRTLPQGRGARWLSVGRLAPNKAVEDAVMALSVTRARHDPAATLTIVGKPVQEAYSQALRAFVSELGLTEAVTFRGHVTDDELSMAFARADVLVVPSVHEGFCVPLVEAMAVGLPVVASRDGVSRDVLGAAGIMVDTHDPATLADAIAELLTDQARYDALVAAGRDQLRVLDLPGAGQRIVDLILGLGRADGSPHQ